MTGRGGEHVVPLFKPPTTEPRERGWNSTLPRASKRMNPVSDRQSQINLRVRDWRERHADAVCVAKLDGCQGRATDPSHRVPRSLMGGHGDDNLDPVCRRCHDWIEHNPIDAKALGLAASNETDTKT